MCHAPDIGGKVECCACADIRTNLLKNTPCCITLHNSHTLLCSSCECMDKPSWLSVVLELRVKSHSYKLVDCVKAMFAQPSLLQICFMNHTVKTTVHNKNFLLSFTQTFTICLCLFFSLL